MNLSTIIYTLILSTLAAMTTDGQINRYINPVWLEMDANSEYYPGGEVIGQILQSYGLADGGAGYRPGPGLRYRPSAVLDRFGYGGSGGVGRYYYPRNRATHAASLNYAAYDTDPLTPQEYADRNYDYSDGTIRASNRYRNSLLDVPVRRNRINVVSVPRTTYYPSEYDLDRGSLPYSRSRSAVGDSAMSQELLLSRGRDTTRLNSRSTVAPNTDDKLKNNK